MDTLLRALALLTLLLLSLSFSNPAFAQPEAPMTGQERQAEYERLGQEMRSRAQKNAWDGVERSYAAMLATGVPLTGTEHFTGAQAASSLGNAAGARQRLQWALEVEDVKEYRDWLHSIDQTYGPVSLKGDPGKVVLSVETMPFDPTQAAAISYAQMLVEHSGEFEGLLPAGTYGFGTMDLRVRPGVHTERIDIRSDAYMRKLERLERKEERGEG